MQSFGIRTLWKLKRHKGFNTQITMFTTVLEGESWILSLTQTFDNIYNIAAHILVKQTEHYNRLKAVNKSDGIRNTLTNAIAPDLDELQLTTKTSTG